MKFTVERALALLCVCGLLAGCIPLVGGPCSYERHAGIAEVIGIKDGHYLLMFISPPQLETESHSRFFPRSGLNGEVFEVRTSYAEVAGAVVGSRFQAEALVMTEGSCVPINYKIGAPLQHTR